MTPEEIVAAARPTTSALMPSRPFIDKLLAQLGDDDDLEAAVELAMARYNRSETVSLLVTAIVRGRPCRAELLGRAMWFLPLELMTGVVAHTPDDPIGALATALCSGRLDEERTLQAVALALAINGVGPTDPRLARALRRVARTDLSLPVKGMFGSMIAETADPNLREVAAVHLGFQARFSMPPHTVDMEELRRTPLYDELQFDSAAGMLAQGITIRHAPRVGRNEPCPCGSGRKHKKCCLENRPSTFPAPATS